MKKKLDLKDVCDLLLACGALSNEQHSLILSRQHEQVKKLKKLHNLKGSHDQFSITPVDIIVSLNLRDQRTNTTLLTEETVMRLSLIHI